jgi:hypothetical protein
MRKCFPKSAIDPCCLSIALIVSAWFCTASGALVDTIVISDGGPGPYGLGRRFIETGSLRLSYHDSLRGPLPSFTFIDQVNAILFSESIDSGAAIDAHFQTRRYGLPRTYSLFTKSYAAAADTSRQIVTPASIKPSAFSDENLVLSGYKSVTVSVNNLGSTNLEQALDVALSGEIAPKTTLSGHLTDQGSSLEGATREVANLDMVYVQLVNPRYSALVGDQYVEWPLDGMFSGKKKIKGLSAGLTLPAFSIKGFGALSSGNFTVQTIIGKNGLQGPYRLEGNGEEGFIIPMHGTVRVSIGEKKFSEGIDQDFSVDYELGAITFSPRKLIRDEDIIRVEYEYRLFDYRRTFTGTEVSLAAFPDSALTLKGALWNEFDQKDNSLDLALSDQDKARLAKAGDSANLSYGGRFIDPKDVAWESSQQALYERTADNHFGFKAYNPSKPTDNQGFYYITFRDVGLGKGDYDIDSTAMKDHPNYGPIYKYVGINTGTAALPLIRLPESNTFGEVQAKARLASFATVTMDLAAMNRDRNLFSSLDDNDNSGAALSAGILLGKKLLDRRSLWLGGSYGRITPSMTREIASSFSRNKQWDDTTGATRSGLRETWESYAGASIFANTFIEGAMGQYLRLGKRITDHFASQAQLTPIKPLSLTYNADFFRHFLDNGQTTTRRGEGKVSFSSLWADVELDYRDEWRTIPNSENTGMAGYGPSLRLTPLPLRESFFHTSFRKGENFFGARDTGYSLSWDQELDRAISPSWHTNASSHYLFRKTDRQNATASLCAMLKNEVSAPAQGLSAQQHYQLNIEKSSAYVQVPVFAGVGLGDHSYDTTLGEYIPDKKGNYIIQEQETYGDTGDNRVRKSKFDLAWTLAKPKKRLPGILGDLDFTGMLDIEEHMQMSPLIGASSWVPGYTSLFQRGNSLDSLIRFAALSYRQGIDWDPDSMGGVHGKLYVQPGLKKIRDYSETETQWGTGIDRTIRRIFLGIDAMLLSVNRTGIPPTSSNSYSVVDRHALATQRYTFPRDIGIYVKETGGWAQKSGSQGGWYYRVSPGITWQPARKGSAEASYTWSLVNIPGTLDYRMAQGFSQGLTHTVDVVAHINVGTHFDMDFSYRGELGGVNSYAKNGLHVASMQMKAFL